MSAKSKAFVIGCIFVVSSLYTLTQQAPGIALAMFLLGLGSFAIWGFLYAHGHAQVRHTKKWVANLQPPPSQTPTVFFILLDDLYGAIHILGKSGFGKSSLIENMIVMDAAEGRSVIFIDPHGDSIDHIIAQMPYHLLDKVYVVDIRAIQFQIGLNLPNVDLNSPLAYTQANDRLAHILELEWPEIMSQVHLPLMLRLTIAALLVNPGSTLLDMYRFLDDLGYRHQCLNNVWDQSVRQFWISFESQPKTDQIQQIMPLKNRIGIIVLNRPIIRNIVGQKETTLKFRQIIENKEILLIKLHVNSLPQDARLLGNLIIAAIHEATFAYSLVPEKERPGFSLYVDEFQTVASKDFEAILTHVFVAGCRMVVLNQYLDQLIPSLKQAVKSARTIICFQVTPEDALDRAAFFQDAQAIVKPEDIDPHPVEWLIKYGSDYRNTRVFIDWYLLPLLSQRRNGQVEIERPGIRWERFGFLATNAEQPKDKPREADPTPYLNNLLHEVMITGRSDLQIPSEIVLGFANCGRGFYARFKYDLKAKYLTTKIRYPRGLLVEQNGMQAWSRLPENEREQLYHFLFHLRETMSYLAANPIGKKTVKPIAEAARELIHLPKEAIWVRSGDETATLYTDETLPACDEDEFEARYTQVKVQTIQKYCHEVADVQPQNVADQDTQPLPTVKPQFRRYKEI